MAHIMSYGSFIEEPITCNLSHDTNTCDQSHDTNTCDQSHDTNTCDQSHDTITCDQSHDTNICDQSHDTNTCNLSHDTNTCDRSHDTITCNLSHDTNICDQSRDHIATTSRPHRATSSSWLPLHTSSCSSGAIPVIRHIISFTARTSSNDTTSTLRVLPVTNLKYNFIPPFSVALIFIPYNTFSLYSFLSLHTIAQ